MKDAISGKYLIIILMIAFATGACKRGGTNNPETPVNNEIDFWLTKSDETVKLQKQTGVLAFTGDAGQNTAIEIDESTTFQTVDGFGYTLTGGSAEVIQSLAASKKQELLKELFGSGDNDISISYLRISIGASDLNAMPYTYNDLPGGETDEPLEKFSLAPDMINFIPLLKEILAISPDIKILATPWTAPVWMKNKNSFIGGELKPQYYGVYAKYFVKYIEAMKAQGITIHAVTPQNEPLHDGNNPSMHMSAAQQADFIKNHLGPAFRDAGLNTRIIIYDHNCDKPEYPLAILDDAAAKAFIDGSAFHLYAGDIGALSAVHDAHPDKALYFTEQYTSVDGNFGGDLKWHLKNVIIGSMRNHSRIALEWNLANNASYGPHTPGGCTTCKGAVTINSSADFTRNVAYYIIAHVSKFVPPGSVRIASNIQGNLQNVAFKTPAGKIVLVVENDGGSAENFHIKYKGKQVMVSLPAGGVGTFIW